MTSTDELPIWAQYSEEGEAEELAAAFGAKPQLNHVVRAETARLVIEQHESLPRWRWLKRRRLVGVLKVLEREEFAARG